MEVRRKRGSVAIIRGLTDGSVYQCRGQQSHPVHRDPQRRYPGFMTPKCSAAALGRCQVGTLANSWSSCHVANYMDINQACTVRKLRHRCK